MNQQQNENSPQQKREWVKPEVKQIHAGSAEAGGTTPII